MTTANLPDTQNSNEHIADIDVADEMQTSFLEYAYSVIYSRALPDARDGLKPVQRRILYMMDEMGLIPSRGHVKSARVVGEVMGKLHPHGDSAIYDALVRLAQTFTLRLPLVDGHGNFGSLDDGPAASRYTEARMAPSAQAMTASLHEDVVDFIPNYDNQLTQPEVLPAAFPNLLVNGATGIAVGMATNMAPHNLTEVIAAARLLLVKPEAELNELMQYVPGPDFPGGGVIVGLDGIKDAYATGRGSFKTRARLTVENISARKTGIVITELPYLVGPEKVIEKIRDGVNSKKLEGISDVTDLTDRTNGMRLIIGVKNGYDPKAVLERLYRFTPLEESFSINNVALVAGQPRTLGLKEMLTVYLEHRIEVTRRRSTFRLNKHQSRLHLLLGLLIAILDIDEVIQVIRSSEEAEEAKTRLIDIFDLSDIQAEYILELRLRRLTKFSRIELEAEKEQLEKDIAELEALLSSEQNIKDLVSDELLETAEKFGTPRRTLLTNAAAIQTPTARSLGKSPATIADSPCTVLLSVTGKIIRVKDDGEIVSPASRTKHDALLAKLKTSNRSNLGAITTLGRLIRFTPTETPEVLPNAVQLSAGVKINDYLGITNPAERVLTIIAEGSKTPLALATKSGIVKRWVPEDWAKHDEFTVITLQDGDAVVGASEASDDSELIFISNDAQLLRYSANLVRPQGRAGSGIAGMKLAASASVIHFAVTAPAEENVVITIASGSQTLSGVEPGRAKMTELAEFPTKGRGTGGVRCQSFLKGEDHLQLAWVGKATAHGLDAQGSPKELPTEFSRRDASGTKLDAVIDTIGFAL